MALFIEGELLAKKFTCCVCFYKRFFIFSCKRCLWFSHICVNIPPLPSHVKIAIFLGPPPPFFTLFFRIWSAVVWVTFYLPAYVSIALSSRDCLGICRGETPVGGWELSYCRGVSFCGISSINKIVNRFETTCRVSVSAVAQKAQCKMCLKLR